MTEILNCLKAKLFFGTSILNTKRTAPLILDVIRLMVMQFFMHYSDIKKFMKGIVFLAQSHRSSANWDPRALWRRYAG